MDKRRKIDSGSHSRVLIRHCEHAVYFFRHCEQGEATAWQSLRWTKRKGEIASGAYAPSQ